MRNRIAALPVSQQERINILDSLRGIAVLGILLINISTFGLPANIVHDPSVLGEHGLNYYTWYFIDLIPEGTQRAIFSLLFGAGIILFTRKLEGQNSSKSDLQYFLERQIWLMVFSLFDVFILLWNGDILLDYACLGFIMVVFRKLPGKTLLICALISFVCMIFRENRDFYKDKNRIYQGEKLELIDRTTTRLNATQQNQLGLMQAYKERNTPERKRQRAETAIQQANGSYKDVYHYRIGRYVDDMLPYLYFGIWDVVLFMLIGMAFFKLGILTGQAAIKTYLTMCIGGIGLGLAISYLRLQSFIDYKFNWFEYTRNANVQLYELSRTFRALGYFGFIMLLYKKGWCKWFFNIVRPTGQMALTNYLMQSLLCGMFFNGIGLGMFGKLERYQLCYVVATIWILQLGWSYWWLRYFRFGPFEWLWRSLTYWKVQPLRKGEISRDAIALA